MTPIPGDAPVAALAAAPQLAQIGLGRVWHRRLRPVAHAFTYPTWFLLLPLRHWRAQAGGPLARNRRAVVSFFDRDHGDGGADALAWCEDLLAREGVLDADGEIWLQTQPRVWGFVFKPVSFWFAERRDGSLAAVLAEVNNTFGERHVYLLTGPQLDAGQEAVAQASKVFHVSPFCRVEGEYSFRFARQPASAARPARTLARIDLADANGLLLRTSVGGTLQPLTAGNLRAALWRMPWLTLGVVWRIHWQALRLAVKRVPFFGKPAAPEAAVTHSH